MINPEIAAKAAAAVGSLPVQCRAIPGSARPWSSVIFCRFSVPKRGRSGCCGRGKEEEREERPLTPKQSRLYSTDRLAGKEKGKDSGPALTGPAGGIQLPCRTTRKSQKSLPPCTSPTSPGPRKPRNLGAFLGSRIRTDLTELKQAHRNRGHRWWCLHMLSLCEAVLSIFDKGMASFRDVHSIESARPSALSFELGPAVLLSARCFCRTSFEITIWTDRLQTA